MNAPTRKCAVCNQRTENFDTWLLAISTPSATGRVAFGLLSDEIDDPSLVQEPLCSASCANVRFSRALSALQHQEVP